MVLVFLLQRPFSEFVYDPPRRGECSSSSSKAWLSMEEIDAIATAYQSLSDEEMQTHIMIQQPTNDFVIEAILGMLARESSESA
jgi:hypothetical protein